MPNVAVLTEQLFPATRQLAQDVEMISHLATFAHERGRLQTNLWLMAMEGRRNSQAMIQKVQALIHKAREEEIDPEDTFSNELLAFQVCIKASILDLRAQLQEPLTAWFIRWMIRKTERELIRQHQLLGQMRTLIMEHDADVSPLLDEVFTSADDLIAALHRDVAA
jgi:hypothetical protein